MVSFTRLALVHVALAAVLAAGCGGSGGSGGSSSTSPTEWADGLCSAITTWSTSVQASAKTLQGGNLSADSLKTATSGITEATNKLATDLKGLGKPDTDAGEKAKEATDQLSSDVKDDVNTMKSAVEDASGASGAATAASTVVATLSKMGTQVSSAATKLQQAYAKGELEKAFKDASSCQNLTGSSG